MTGHGAPDIAGSPSRLALVGCLLPVLATVFFLLVLFAWPNERHRPASDLQTVLFFVSLGLVPLAALAGIVLAVTAIVRARRQGDSASGLTGRGMAVAAIVTALLCVAVMAGVLWLALIAVSAFR